MHTYESYRVADIQKLGDEVEWRHVRSRDNPADSLSRGQLPIDLVNNFLWVSGPQWLSLSDNNWPQSPSALPDNLTGFQEGIVLVTTASGSTIYSRFSNYGCLVRSVAYLRRWKEKGVNSSEIPNTGRSKRGIRYLSPIKIADAERIILFLIQRESFNPEIKLLKSAQKQNPEKLAGSFRSRTKFDELNPFLDDDDLIRVGGRLKKSDLLFNQKHPILLPSNHHVSDLIFVTPTREIFTVESNLPFTPYARDSGFSTARIKLDMLSIAAYRVSDRNRNFRMLKWQIRRSLGSLPRLRLVERV